MMQYAICISQMKLQKALNIKVESGLAAKLDRM